MRKPISTRVLALLALIAVTSLSTPAFASPSKPVFRPLPESLIVTAGSDARIVAEIEGLTNPEIVVSGQQYPFTNLTGTIYAAYVPGCFITYSTTSARFQAQDSRGKLFTSAISLSVQGPCLVEEWEGGRLFQILQDDSLARYFYDVENHGNSVNGASLTSLSSTIVSPKNGASDYNIIINSSVNQARTDGTNPHKGLDLDLNTSYRDEAVYNMKAGTILNIGPDWVQVGVDVNGNGSNDINFYYVHITVKSGLAAGQWLAAGSQVGNIISAQNHVHISVRDNANYDIPQRLVWQSKAFNSGKDVDFVKMPTFPSNGIVRVESYGMNDGSVPTYSGTVWIVHRRYGFSTWITSSMSKVDNKTWQYDLTTFYGSASDIEYYIMANRSGFPTSMKMYRPMMYNIYGATNVSTPPTEYLYVTIY